MWTIIVDDARFHVSDENDKEVHVYAHRLPWSEFARVDPDGNVLSSRVGCRPVRQDGKDGRRGRWPSSEITGSLVLPVLPR
jgi:hypothetical protein